MEFMTRKYIFEDDGTLGMNVPHLGPCGEMAQESYDCHAMSEYLGRCLLCGSLIGLIGCTGCGDVSMKDEKRPPLRSKYSRDDYDRRRQCFEAPKRHEESTAKSLGGRKQKASGSKYDAKGDVAMVKGGRFEFHGECKTTEGQSLRLEAQWLNKITSEAADLWKYPFLAIRFQEDVLKALASKLWRKVKKPVEPAEQDWIAVPRSVFIKMLSDLNEHYEGDDGV